MSIWFAPFSVEDVEAFSRHTADRHLGVRVTAFGPDWLEGVMPLDERTSDASGALHAGALSVLAETLGSIAANLCVDLSRQRCLGQILHVHHPGAVTRGPVTGRAVPLLMSSTHQTWQIDIMDASGERICVSQLTMAVVDRGPMTTA